MVFNNMELYRGSSPSPEPTPTPPTPTYTTSVIVYYPSDVDYIGIVNIDSGSSYSDYDYNPSGYTVFDLPRGGSFRIRWFKGSTNDYRDVTVAYGQSVTVNMGTTPTPEPTTNIVLNFYIFDSSKGKTIYVEKYTNGIWYNNTSVAVPAHPSENYVSCTVHEAGTYRASFINSGTTWYYLDDSSQSSWTVTTTGGPYTYARLSNSF